MVGLPLFLTGAGIGVNEDVDVDGAVAVAVDVVVAVSVAADFLLLSFLDGEPALFLFLSSTPRKYSWYSGPRGLCLA